MADERLSIFGHWREPAHPGIIKLHDDLVAILSLIRDKYQSAIDKAFDAVSRQIGFVVTTTLPAVIEVAAGGKISAVKMGAENLRGTIFERGFGEVLGPMAGQQISTVAPGTYKLHLIWLGALKLRLPCEWCEPAHLVSAAQIRPASSAGLFDFGPIEPAQWFNPGLMVSVEDAVLIEALDEVYPQLKLIERIGQIRAAIRTRVSSHVREPAHPPWEAK
jgi:hypothetical protein